MATHKVQYMDRVEVTYVAPESRELIVQMGFIDSQRKGILFELPMQENPRNIDGYRTKLYRDLEKIRSTGSVVNYVYLPHAIELAKRGKLKIPGIEIEEAGKPKVAPQPVEKKAI